MRWQEFILNENIIFIADNELKDNRLMNNYGVYGESVYVTDECRCFMARDDNGKFLIVTGGNSYDKFEGVEIEVFGDKVKKCPLSIYNSSIIRSIFPFASPVSAGGNKASIGLGDRLGLASPGHVRLIKNRNVFPVLAQQSIRELNLTGRTFNDVLSAAVWAVFQEGYKDGYGADGDHLKTADEVNMALDCGFTMVTLDCSEHIDNSIDVLGIDEISTLYNGIEKKKTEYWENRYCDKVFSISTDISLAISLTDLMPVVLTYGKALEFAEKIYSDILKDYERDIDFEISIDETLTPTSATAHYIIASELTQRGVKIKNMAPRFCGEFQKGIDYRGSAGLFEKEFKVHCAIAEKFGYRISVHSGSDKFSIFQTVGVQTKGNFHVKTAGTNWLEALRVIAIENPALFRVMYKHAFKRLPDAKKFYHIFTEPDLVPVIDNYREGEFAALLDIEESRQALHITYGYLLCDKSETGRYIFREEFFSTLHKCESTYYEFLRKHIGRHLEYLGICSGELSQ